MAWTGSGAGTIGDPWQINTRARLTEALANNVTATFMKLTSNIDCTLNTGVNAVLGGNLKGCLDGDGYKITGLLSYYSYDDGFTIFNGCALKNITFEYTRSTNAWYGWGQVLYTNGDTLTAVTLDNIRVTVGALGHLMSFTGNFNFGAGSVISNITLEGRILHGFQGRIEGNVSGVKFLRTEGCFNNTDNRLPFLFYEVYGTIYRCQVIIPSFIANGIDMEGAILVNQIYYTTIIRECLIIANINITQLNPVNTSYPMHILYSRLTYAGGSIVENNLILGNYYLNGGGVAGINPDRDTKSGFVLGPSNNTIHRKNIFIGDLDNTYFDNRAPFCRAQLGAGNANNFYAKNKIISMTAIDDLTRQVGLTDPQLSVSSNFAGLDFTDIWEIPTSTPELKFNKPTGYSISFSTVGLSNVHKINAGSFGLDLSTFAVSSYGVDVLEGETIVFNSANNANPVFAGISADHLYRIRAYYMDGATKVYTTDQAYQHYYYNSATEVTVINEISRITLNNPSPVAYVHGSIFHDGYIYGTTRNIMSFSTSDGYLVRAQAGNLSNCQQIPIRVSDPVVGSGDTSFSHNLEQIVLCGGKLYSTFYNESLTSSTVGQWLMQYDPQTNDYKVYQIWGINSICPIISDGRYLYFATGNPDRKIYKVDPEICFISSEKYNPNSNSNPLAIKTLESISIAFYDEDSQGGYIAGNYSPENKGLIHSFNYDSTYLYLFYTTPLQAFPNGYDIATGRTYCELHKVKLSDMSPHSWVYIPQTTDDTAINQDYIFAGVEIALTANINTLGKGWSTIAINKTTLEIYPLPALFSLDTNLTQSYAVKIFGNYLINLRINGYYVVLDISDPSQWSAQANIGQFTLAVLQNKYLNVSGGLAINEIVSDSTGNLYGFYWHSTALLSQFTLPGYNILVIPTLENAQSNIGETDITLSAHILSNGGQPVTAKGFIYGTDPQNLNNSIASEQLTDTFSAILTGLEAGMWYWQAFATNLQGTAYTPTQTFLAPETMKIYFAGQKFKKIYLGTNVLKFV